MDGPESHLASGLAPAAADVSAATHGLFHVHSCKGHQRPACAFVAIRHRDHWYYIDDRDHESKATMLLVMQLRRLDFQRQRIGVAPALTLPIGR